MKQYSAAAIAELESGSVQPVLFIEVSLDARTDRFCTASSDIEWNSQTWVGTGGVISVESINESDDLTAHGLKFVIGGLTQSDTAAFLTDRLQGRDCTCWVGFIGASGVVADPEIEYQGRLDAASRTIGEDLSVGIVIPVESRMLRWNVASGSRFTHEEQLRLHPGDTCLSRVANLAESVELNWPAKEYFFQ